MTEFPGNPIPSTVPAKLCDRIQYWDDEREEGGSLIVTLKSGYRWDDHGSHVLGFDTTLQAVQWLRHYSQACQCELCK